MGARVRQELQFVSMDKMKTLSEDMDTSSFSKQVDKQQQVLDSSVVNLHVDSNTFVGTQTTKAGGKLQDTKEQDKHVKVNTKDRDDDAVNSGKANQSVKAFDTSQKPNIDVSPGSRKKRNKKKTPMKGDQRGQKGKC